MTIDTAMFSGPCACGQAHSLATKLAIIDEGCLSSLDAQLVSLGLTGRRAALYDTNTYEAKGLVRPRVDQEIILNAENLRADESAVAQVLAALKPDTEILIVIGAGTLHDIGRYCAFRQQVSLVSCPTAASGDSFASPGCAMTWRGLHTALPGVAPVLVLADLRVIAQAPPALFRAGIGSALGDHIALADWQISQLLAEAASCPRAESLLRQAAVVAQGSCPGLLAGDIHAFAQLTCGLLLSGLAMQMLQSVAPASGAEHMLCAAIEMGGYPQAQSLVQGELIGICAAELARPYHRLAQVEAIAPYIRQTPPPDDAWWAEHFGPALGRRLMDANTPDCLLTVDPNHIAQSWPRIRRILAETPSQDALVATLDSIGAPSSLQALSLSAGQISRLLHSAPYLRNQLTAARMLHMLAARHSSNEAASRAPSRKSRYADNAITRAGKSRAASASSIR